jgi:hypothetical protein
LVALTSSSSSSSVVVALNGVAEDLNAALNLKSELPLLKVESVSATADIPDDLYPLSTALFSHSAKLLRLRSRLSRAELDQILLAAEALVMADPDRTLTTDRALECLRGAILRPAASAMITSSAQVNENEI